MRRIKKAFTLFLAVSVFNSQLLFAADKGGFFDSILESSLMNITPMGLYNIKDANGNVTDYNLYVPGGVYFRFGAAHQTPPPLFTVASPKASIGCGGLSIKGMFVSILGLDRLEMMLKNAGASLAWGIAIGLIYSLPGVMKAFEFINHWADKIQQLLANACQSGVAIGRSLSRDAGFDGESGMFATIGQTINNYVDSMDQATKTFFDRLGINSKNFTDNMVYKGWGELKNNTSKQQRDDIWGALLNPVFIERSFSVDLLMGFLETMGDKSRLNFIEYVYEDAPNNISPFEMKKFAITLGQSGKADKIVVVGIDSILNWVKKGGVASLGYESTVGQSIFATGVAKYVGADIVAQDLTKMTELARSVKFISKQSQGTNSVANNNNNATIPSNQSDPSSSTLLTQIATGTAKASFFGVDSLAQSNSILTQGLFDVLYHGKDSAGNQREIKIPAIGYGTIMLPNDVTISPKSTPYNNRNFLFFALSRSDTEEINLVDSATSQKGLFLRSKELIQAYMDGYAKDGNISLEALQEQYKTVMLVPNLFGKLQTLQQSMPYDRENYIEILAAYNAIQVIKGIFNAYVTLRGVSKPMMPVVVLEDGATRVTSNKMGASASKGVLYASSQQNTASRMDELIKSFDAQIKDIENKYRLNELDLLFKELNSKNAQRAREATPQNPIQ